MGAEASPHTTGQKSSPDELPRSFYHTSDGRFTGLHPLAIEDMLNPNSRVKLEERPRYVFPLPEGLDDLRRHLAPQREVFSFLTNRPSALLTPESQVYFRDVYDHVRHTNDSLDTYRELLSSTLDSYLTQVSNRLGEITKGLSVVATISLPFVISGMWGMNVANISLSQHPHAFWWMLGFQTAIGIALLLTLRQRRLL